MREAARILAAMPLGRVTASDADQLLLNVPLDRDLGGPRRLRLVINGGKEAFGDQTLADAADGARTDLQSRSIAQPQAADSAGLDL